MIHFIVELLRTITAILEKEVFYAKKECRQCRPDKWINPGGILAFTIPLFLGQLLQQFYNMVDAWVIGNFADNNAFAAVSSTGTIVF